MNRFLEEVTIEPICYAHQLRLPYSSPCNALHGHGAKVVIVLSTSTLDRNAMGVDFTAIKDVVKRLDHAVLGVVRDIEGRLVSFTKHIPMIEPSTAENIAAYLLFEVGTAVSALNPLVLVESVSFWETPSSKVTVTGS